jgi:hypothetical protein
MFTCIGVWRFSLSDFTCVIHLCGLSNTAIVELQKELKVFIIFFLSESLGPLCCPIVSIALLLMVT